MVGIVVPLYLTKFIDSSIKNFKETASDIDAVFCFVNDGKKEIKEHFDKIKLPSNMHVVHRETNGGFATANNTGWKYLLENYPDIDYLGTINDDTVPKKNWLSELIKSIEKNNVSCAVPNVRGISDGLESEGYAVFKFVNNPGNPMLATHSSVKEDTITKGMSGCCFVSKTECLKKFNFFDGKYMNGCEDVDLALKFALEGYKIIASAKSTIAHIGGCSRYIKPGIDQDIQKSISLISLRWGSNFDAYNYLN